MEFDVPEWMSRLSGAISSGDGSYFARPIIGPRDACIAVHLRRLLHGYVHAGKSVPTDVFLLTTGEPTNRLTTKVSGLPYLRRGRQWPKDSGGRSIPFLYQFFLRDSRDHLGEPPGDVLLVFGRPGTDGQFVVEWEQSGVDAELIDQVPSDAHASTPCYGTVRWRTESFPEWEVVAGGDRSMITLDNNISIYQVYYVFQFLAMQASKAPFVPPVQDLFQGETVVCSFPSVAPTIGAIYPFVDRKQPLTEDEARDARIMIGEVLDADSFSILYVVCNKSGKWRVEVTSL